VLRKLLIALALAVPAVVIAMVPHMLALHPSRSTAQALRGVELLSPLIAALAMSLSSVSVIGNALRLRARE